MVDRIRELLSARQFTPTQFADTIGVARPIVSHILSGRNKPSLEVVQKIVDAFPDVSLPWLLKGMGGMDATEPAPAAPDPSPAPPTSKRTGTKVLETPRPAAAKEQSVPMPTTAPAKAVGVTSEANLGVVASIVPLLGSVQPVFPLPEPSVAASPGPQEAPAGSLPEPTAPIAPMPVASVPASYAVVNMGPASAGAAEVKEGKKPEATLPAAAQPFLRADKAIRRIVIFYQDGTFTDYQPETA